MNLHEYQAKTLFRAYGVDTPRGQLAHSPDEAVAAAEALGGNVWADAAKQAASKSPKAWMKCASTPAR